MKQSYTIEVLSPSKFDWSFYEDYMDTVEGAREHLFCVRKAFPMYSVRAIDRITGKVFAMIKGAYADD